MPELYVPGEPFGRWLAKTLGELWFEVQWQAAWAIRHDLGDRWFAVFSDANGRAHLLDLGEHNQDDQIWLMRLHTNYYREPESTVMVRYYLMPEGWQDEL